MKPFKRGYLNNLATAYMPAIPMPADCVMHGGNGDEETCTWCIIRKIDTAEYGALSKLGSNDA